jgi:hypothetical protein
MKRQEQAASQKQTSGALAALREEIKTLSREHKEINDKSDAVCTFSKILKNSQKQSIQLRCIVNVLGALTAENSDIIIQLKTATGVSDAIVYTELQILKKQKLSLKDKITRLQRLLDASSST